MRFRTAISFALPLLVVACVIPIPTPEWGDEPISREQFDAIEGGVGVLARGDVETMLGKPQLGYADGRVIVYSWTRRQGIWIAGVPAGFGGYGGIAAGDSEHHLCLKFDDDGGLEDTEHIDSALFMAGSMLASLLDVWLGSAAAVQAAPGYARFIDVDNFVMASHDGSSVGIMLYAETERRPSCWNELHDVAVHGYRLYRHDELRDTFYPWLEPPWYDNVGPLATSEALEDARAASRLRFIVVASNKSNRFAGELCDSDNPYTVSCYEIRFRDERGRAAVLDLAANPTPPGRESPTVETLKIPVFPMSRRQACKTLMVYAADDISRLVHASDSPEL